MPLERERERDSTEYFACYLYSVNRKREMREGVGVGEGDGDCLTNFRWRLVAICLLSKMSSFRSKFGIHTLPRTARIVCLKILGLASACVLIHLLAGTLPSLLVPSPGILLLVIRICAGHA